MAVYSRCTLFPRVFIPITKKSALLNLSSIQRLSCLSSDRKLMLGICTTGPKRILSANFHCGESLYKRRKSVDEKKLPNLKEFSPKPKSEVIEVWRNITARELARVMNKNVSFIEDLFLNKIRGGNTVLSDLTELQNAIRRSGKKMKIIPRPTNGRPAEEEDKDVYPRPPADPSLLKPRPPVVTVMGHVDHGKTTLLDALRHSNIVEQEFGGITQHIGAFSVTLQSGATVTFLDTPGHAAFTSMRERGANITDIVVLVVAADDGVMEQTVESVRMAKQANVPILVAINKIDSPKADVPRTERMLIEVGIQVENMGGDVQAVPISALKRKNLEQLTEALAVQAELLQIKADPTGLVEGTVVESKVDTQRGKVCTMVVQRGTLKKGKVLVAGTSMAKVRMLRDAEGKVVSEAPPGCPVEVEGWKMLPSAGDVVLEVESEKQARTVISVREEKKEKEKEGEVLAEINAKHEQHLIQYHERLKLRRSLGRFKLRREGPRKKEIEDDDGKPELNIILKCDVDGTLEAILNALDTYESDKCPLELVHYGVGAITESDVELASTFKAIIYTFNLNCPPKLGEAAEDAKIPIKQHNVIYKLIEDVKSEINSRLPTKEVEESIGEAEVIQQFDINEGRKKVPVAGCKCTKGLLKRSCQFKLMRNGEVIHDGPLISMRHLKNEVDVIKKGLDCGLQLANKDIQFQPGDLLICYEKKMQPQETDWDPGF